MKKQNVKYLVGLVALNIVVATSAVVTTKANVESDIYARYSALCVRVELDAEDAGLPMDFACRKDVVRYVVFHKEHPKQKSDAN